MLFQLEFSHLVNWLDDLLIQEKLHATSYLIEDNVGNFPLSLMLQLLSLARNLLLIIGKTAPSQPLKPSSCLVISSFYPVLFDGLDGVLIY